MCRRVRIARLAGHYLIAASASLRSTREEAKMKPVRQIEAAELMIAANNFAVPYVEESHGTEALNLVLARGYLSKIFANTRITRYLSQHHADLFGELQNMLTGATDNS